MKHCLQRERTDSIWECFPFAFSSAKGVLSLGYQHMAQMLILRKIWHTQHAKPCYFLHMWHLASVMAIQCQIFLNVRNLKNGLSEFKITHVKINGNVTEIFLNKINLTHGRKQSNR